MRKLAALAALCLSAAGAAAQEGTFTLGAGLHYSEGDYGTPDDTKITSFQLTGRYDRERWIYKLTVPYLHVSGGQNVVPGIGAVDRSRGTSSASGLGDVVAAATWNAHYDSTSMFGIDLTGKIKFGTADEREGLGTGENDFSFGADAYKSIDRMTLFGGLGYTIFGDPPGFQLNNGFFWSVGASWKLPPRESVGLSLDGRQEIAPGSGDQRELVGFWSRALDGAWKAQAYFLVGLANGSPDWGGGLTLARPF
ncbi:MAG TPA: hypothetical protein VF110_00600 [Burkholderiales bacterium]